MSCKVYVDVMAQFRAGDGMVLPRSITWEDGIKYTVDRVLDVRPAASLKGGGAGLRYTVRILGKSTYIWREEDRWFVERKADE